MLVECVGGVQSLTEIARQRMVEDGVESYLKQYPGCINFLRRMSSWSHVSVMYFREIALDYETFMHGL